MSNFDPTAFLDATITEVSVKRLPLPAGQDFVGIVGDIKGRNWTSRDGTKSGVAMDVPVTIDCSAYPELNSQAKVTLQDSIMLDVTEAGGIDLAPGKNTKLRRYREALGMNVAGEPFSFRAMTGRMIKVKIKHDPYEGEIYDKIDSVAKA
jgi:hypothetical protein